jgi:hypothetical protein
MLITRGILSGVSLVTLTDLRLLGLVLDVPEGLDARYLA